MYVELASREPPDLAALLPAVASHLVEMGVIRAPEAICFAWVRRLDPAYVVFDHRRAEAVATVERHLEHHGGRSAGHA